ncbi:hypothetical protein H671_xg20301 [Cricetulus griseus]|uniref:Uncharacterized protein n=1 Tax=Cricetulus griseus TaxID=10029 RepID=A0A061HVJ7_CRIGR|nr:hypothetical protein H671_xg20301 [Cricetulus griseus]
MGLEGISSSPSGYRKKVPFRMKASCGSLLEENKQECSNQEEYCFSPLDICSKNFPDSDTGIYLLLEISFNFLVTESCPPSHFKTSRPYERPPKVPGVQIHPISSPTFSKYHHHSSGIACQSVCHADTDISFCIQKIHCGVY